MYLICQILCPVHSVLSSSNKPTRGDDPHSGILDKDSSERLWNLLQVTQLIRDGSESSLSDSMLRTQFCSFQGIV